MQPLTKEQWDAILKVDTYSESREEFTKRMKAEGFETYFPAEDELFLDIDSEKEYKAFELRFSRLKAEYPDVKILYNKSSKSGLPCRHIIIQMPFELENDYERIAFQAVLGSDPTRELLSLFRAENGDPYPTLLVDKNI